MRVHMENRICISSSRYAKIVRSGHRNQTFYQQLPSTKKII